MTGRLRARTAGDDGNALVEFVYLAVLLMVPLVYVLLAVFHVQGAAYAVSSAAREAGRVYATSGSPAVAAERAFTAAAIVMRDSNLRLAPRDLRIRCSSDPCLAPGSRVEVDITHAVSLPLLPRLFDGRGPAVVRVSSHHLEVVDRFRVGPR